MTDIKIGHILLWTATLLAVGCTTVSEDEILPIQPSAHLRFGGSQCRVITRAGDSAERFADGTKYDLYALDAASSPANWLTSGSEPALMSNLEGVEKSATDEIFYGTEQIPYEGRTVNIYAVTLGTTDNPGKNEGGVSYMPATTASAPKYGLTAALDESSLPGIPDLMRVKYTGAQSDDGKIALEFRHTLSKLTFEVVKQNESGDDSSQHELEGIYVASIRLKGVRTGATLDLASGDWESLTGGTSPDDDRSFFTMDPGSPWEVPHTTPQVLTTGDGKNGNATREAYIFPNTAGDGNYLTGEQSRPLEVEVTLGKTGDNAYNKSVIYKLHRANADGSMTQDAFRFKTNFEYRLTITVLRDDVRVVTVSPSVYDWIPAFPDGDKDVETVGRPVTFGNLMWMDRNLGAGTADCKSLDSWYKSIGYFYQHGRNIPFILDYERFLDPANFSNLNYFDNGTNNLSHRNEFAVMSMTHVAANGVETPAAFTSSVQNWVFQDTHATDPKMFYTYNYRGEKTYGAVRFYDSDTPNVVPVRFPGERPRQWSAGGLVDAPEKDWDRAYRLSAVYTAVQTWYAPITATNDYWSDTDNQPCPAGWRLPTFEDLKTFMPYIGKKIDWNVVQWGGVPTTSTYRPFLRFGWLNITHEGQTMKVHRCRHIINLGKSNASRIQIESRPVPGCTNKRYIHVARYPITDVSKDMYYYMDPDGDGTLDDALWQDKDIVEDMYFPAAGGLVTDNQHYPAWRWLGEGIVLRTSENNDTGTFATVCYIASSDMELQIATNSRRVVALQARCVRDVR